jgi:hypothetical protein
MDPPLNRFKNAAAQARSGKQKNLPAVNVKPWIIITIDDDDEKNKRS